MSQQSPILNQTTGLFEKVGELFNTFLKDFTISASDTIIYYVTPVVSAAMVMFFIFRGYLILMGKSDGALQDLFLTMGKMALVIGIALTTGKYSHYVIETFDGLSQGLTQTISKALPGNSASYANPWGALDTLWVKYFEAAQHSLALSQKFSFNPSRLIVNGLIGIFAFLFISIQAIIITSLSVGILFIAEFSSKFLLAIGPLFFAFYLFAPTRDFFFAWLKTLLTPLYMMMLIVTALSLASFLAPRIIDEVSEPLADSSNIVSLDVLSAAGVMFLFSGGIFLIIKQVPNLASSLSGSGQIHGAGLGSMAKSVVQGGAALASGGATMAALVAKGAGSTAGYNALRKFARGADAVNRMNGGNMAGSLMGGVVGQPLGAAVNAASNAASLGGMDKYTRQRFNTIMNAANRK